jgi:hypothetical protein
MKSVLLLMAVVFAASFASAFQASNGTTDLKNFNKIKCSTGLTCSRSGDAMLVVSSPSITGPLSVTGAIVGDGTGALSGMKQSQVASTSVAIVAAQCGKTFVSNSADVMVLPEASTVLGCRLTFVGGTADDFDINPADATDTIAAITASGGTITPSAGDAIRITDIGASVVLEAIGANAWAAVSHNGVLTDVD